MIKQLITPAVAIVLLTACNNKAQQRTEKGDILIANLDTTADPANDFFEYANGGWLKANEIPASESSWGIAHLVNEELYNRKRTINEEAASKKGRTGVDKLIGDFWQTAMDSVKAEQQGLSPLKPVLNRINTAVTPADIMQTAAYLHTLGVNVLFTEGVGQDARNSEVMSYQLYQGGLGLPNRDYYFNTDKRSVDIRAAYPAFVASMLRATGATDDAAARANTVIALETRLAKVSRKLEDLRDPYKNYNKMSVAGLTKLSPGIDWQTTFKNIGMPQLDTVIVGQPEFYKELAAVIKTTPVPVLKDYMAYHLVNEMASYLNKSVADADFDFYGRILKGAKEQRPRWKKVLDAEEEAMGEALGKLFAAEYFNETAKKRYTDIVENVRNAYRLRLEKLDWMSDSTREKAIAKLGSIKKKVGYPDKWKDFSAMKIGTESFAANMMAASEWWHKYQISKYGKPVDREEWEMTPQTYNAYYNPSNNEIVMPAGIFTVPGYRDEDLDDALVYGYAAASTVGHEITHGFDDEGRQFDEKGNLQSWWTKQDEAQFNKKAAVLVQQFNNIVAVDSLHINGKASLGENLADLGGVLIGVDAFKNTATFKKGGKINGLTPLQRFFLGYSLGWLYKQTQEELASRILTDVHSPAKWRVNGIFPNVPAFYEAFDIKPGSKMYLPDSARVKLW